MKEHHFKRSKLAELIEYKDFIIMYAAYNESQTLLNKYKAGIPLNKRLSNSKGANLLTRLVILKLRQLGHFAERTGNTGTYRQGKQYTALNGYRTHEKGMFVKGQGTNGTSDIKAIIKGRFVAIEIKYKKDRMSKTQIKYKNEVERAGGTYLIVSHMNDLLSYLKSNYSLII
ncbi:MAG: hypothetical protein GXO80_10220 [Chlorobi bacterium]|nr:hypothetical protein [Chlorobiota bacterium]